MAACGGCGPGYATPRDAFYSGSQEKLVYLPCIIEDKTRPDYLATVDTDPTSPTYSQVISRLHFPYLGDEIHHTGWNACSSCYDDPSRSRSRLIVPALGSDRVYVVDVKSDPFNPKLDKIIEPWEMHALGVGTPHTTHCLADGNVMISTLSDGPKKNGKGNFILLDGKTFKPKGLWVEDKKDEGEFGYDFWYQPYHNVMISTEWGHPRSFFQGLNMEHVEGGHYGTHLNVYDWTTRKLIQKIDLGMEGVMPLEIRFLHDPKATVGFVGCALFSNMFRIFKTEKGDWDAEKVIDIPNKKVEGWIMPEMPGVMTDILISMDDRFLYFSNWLHGDVRQYDITDTRNPKLTGQIFFGGLIQAGGPVKVIEDKEMSVQPQVRYARGKKIEGAPQMLQLSLDGKRLYVTSSLFSPWDKQFYPDMCSKGSMMFIIDCDTENGGMQLNNDFCVDFGEEPDGPSLAHEVRYPGGDCTSDIYVADMDKIAKM